MIDTIADGKTPLVVLFPFPEDSRGGQLLQKAAAMVERMGQPVHLLFRDTLPMGGKGPFHVLAFVKTVEETGQLALRASSRMVSGDVVYGGTLVGISLERGNVITSFGSGHFQSSLVETADWAFPLMGDRNMAGKRWDPILEKTVLQVYMGLMIHAAGMADSLLSTMDEARHVWKMMGDEKIIP